jgi:hypothetical protein
LLYSCLSLVPYARRHLMSPPGRRRPKRGFIGKL